MAIPTTVTTAVSAELTMLRRSPDHTSVARVKRIANWTTAMGTTTHRRLRKERMITAASSTVDVQPRRQPSSST